MANKMADNILTTFTRENITELILGIVIAVIIVLFMDLNFQEGMFIILLGPLSAVILNQFFKVFVPNTKNQRTALVILALIGGFVLIQQFNLGIFSLDNVNALSFVEVPTQSQTALIATPIAITGSLIAALGKLPFLIVFVIILMILFTNPVTAPFGIILLAIVGIPALIVLGVGAFLIAKNFTLILILIGGFSILKLLLGAQVRKQALKS